MTSVSIEVERPAAEVFSSATDPTKFHEWQQGVVSGSMEARARLRSATTAARPAGSVAPSDLPPLSWSGSNRRVPGRFAASTGLSAPRSISPLSHSRTSAHGSPLSSTSRVTE